MKGYSSVIPENCARARLEGVNASYKDLTEVCGRIRGKKTVWALSFLEKAAAGELPVLYKRHNKKLGHRRELGGKQGRYPEKAAGIVRKLLQSVIANGKVKGLGDTYTILAVSAGKKHIYPRLSPKGKRVRMTLQTSRVEIVLKGSDVPKGVAVTLPQKAESAKSASAPKNNPVGVTTKPNPVQNQKTGGVPNTNIPNQKTHGVSNQNTSNVPNANASARANVNTGGVPNARANVGTNAGVVSNARPNAGGVQNANAGTNVNLGVKSGEAAKPAARKDEMPVVGNVQHREQSQTFKEDGKAHEHKHEAEKLQEQEKKRTQTPHQHAEHNKR